MKLRIRGDSVRLRLKRHEVDQIAAGNSVVEETRFPEAVFIFRLDATKDEELSASFVSGSLVVRLPEVQAQDWAATDTVSLHTEQKLPDGGTLSLLIEKDFTCLAPGHHRDCKDDEDTFAHPDAS